MMHLSRNEQTTTTTILKEENTEARQIEEGTHGENQKYAVGHNATTTHVEGHE